jgi:hypothetical protein
MVTSPTGFGDPILDDRDPTPKARVVEELEATRRAMRRCLQATGLLRIALVVLALAAVLALADWMWILPVGVRAAGLVAMLVVGAVLGIRLALRIGRFDREDAAVGVEEGHPELGQRVRTALEYLEPTPDTAPASPGLVGALVDDTDRRTRGLDFGEVVPWATFERLKFAAVVAVLAALVTLCASPGLRTAALRLALRPAHYTTIEVKPGDKTVKAGDDFTLTVNLAGRPVRSAYLLHRRAVHNTAWTAVPLGPTPRPGEPARPLTGALESTLKDCQIDLEYRVVAGDVESPTYRLNVLHPLKLRQIVASITPPNYTRRPPSVLRQGNFEVVEGSRVRLTFALDRDPRSAELVLISGEGGAAREKVPLRIRQSRLSADLPPLTKDVAYELNAKAPDGMALESARFQIRVKPDEKPTIRFIRPRESLAVLPTAEVPMHVEAADDYGVARVGIAYKLGNGPEESLYLRDHPDQPPSVEALAKLYLEKHKLSYTDGLTYYAFVEDNRPYRPHRVVTDLRFLDILPYKQAFQLVEGGGT